MADNIIQVKSKRRPGRVPRRARATPNLETARALGQKASAEAEVGQAYRQIAEGTRAVGAGEAAGGRASAAIGQGMQAIGSSIGDVHDAKTRAHLIFETARQEQALAETTNLAVERLNQAQRKGPMGDIGGSIRAFEDEAEKIKSELSEGLQTDREKAEFGTHFENLKLVRVERVRNAAVADAKDVGRASLSQTVDSLMREAAFADDEAGRLAIATVAEQRVRQAAAAGIISHSAGENLVQSFTSGSAEIRARQIIRENPYLAMTMLEDPDSFVGLDPLKREQLLGSAAVDIRSQQTRVKSGIKDDIAEIERAAALGLPVSDDRIDAARSAAMALGDQETFDRVNRIEEVSVYQRGLQQLSLPEARQAVADLEASVNNSGDTAPNEAAKIKVGRATVSRMTAELKRDPLSFANAAGVTQVEIVDFSQGNMDALGRRREQALEVAEHYGIPPKFFTAEERDRFSQSLKNANAEDGYAAMRSLVDAFGVNAPQAASELGDDVPVHAHLAALSSMGAQYDATARAGFRGLKAVESKAVELPSRRQTLEVLNDVMSGAVDPSLSKVYGRIHEAARAIYANKVLEMGLGDFQEREAKDAFELSVRQAAGEWGDGKGGIASHNGRKLLLPQNLDEDEFGDVLSSLDSADLASVSLTGSVPKHVARGNKMRDATAEDIRDGYLVTIGHGRYRVSVTDPQVAVRFLLDPSNGEPWIMDLSEVPKPESAVIRPVRGPWPNQ